MNPPVDLLIQGCQVVCFDPAETIIEDGAIAITGNTITAVGSSACPPVRGPTNASSLSLAFTFCRLCVRKRAKCLLITGSDA